MDTRGEARATSLTCTAPLSTHAFYTAFASRPSGPRRSTHDGSIPRRTRVNESSLCKVLGTLGV